MVLYFLLAFIAIPLIEIAIFLHIGELIGLWWTLAAVVATALGGTAMLRNQSVAVLYRAKGRIKKGTIPLREVFDGLCLLIAGVLLLTPGFVTDIAGGLLFLPFFRTLLARMIKHHIIASGKFQEPGFGTPRDPDTKQGSSIGKTIDGEFEEVEPESTSSDFEKQANTRNS